MKKIIIEVIALLVICSVEAQDSAVQFIDSINREFSINNTILLFSELPDTVDVTTGLKFSQRNSYYYDWHQKELRLIDAYRFDKPTNRQIAERAFRRNKKIPSGTEVQYVFFRNSLVKVTVTPTSHQCTRCFAEYYFSNDELIFKNEKQYSEPSNKFLEDAAFFLARLAIRK